MAAIARILQAIGWMWVIAGVLLPAVGVARLNIFPGFILIFVARALRTQAARHAPPPEEQVENPVETQRRLARERERPAPLPTPPPRAPEVTPPPQEAEPASPAVPAMPTKRDELIERIAIAGMAAQDRSPETERAPVIPPEDEERKTPMSSAEMIAQAKKRWDKKS